MANLLASAVKRITIETNWAPTIVVDDPFSANATGRSNAAATFLQPRITVELNPDLAQDPMHVSPWGDPTPRWPTVRNVSVGFGVLMALAAGVMLYRKAKGKSALVP